MACILRSGTRIGLFQQRVWAEEGHRIIPRCEMGFQLHNTQAVIASAPALWTLKTAPFIHKRPALLVQCTFKLSSLEKSVREIKALLLAQKRPQQDDALDGLELFLPHGGKLESMEELIELEKMLQVEEHKRRLVQVLSTMEGGENVGKICRALMRALMTNGLMSQFSARGQKGKLAFKDRLLCDVILKAVRKSSNGDCRDSDIMYEIAGVLRNAPNHPGGTNYHKLGCTRKRKAEVIIKEMPVESD